MGVVLRNLPNDVVSGLDGVVMASNSCALGKGQFEEVGKFPLGGSAGPGKHRVPHVGDDNNALQCRATTEVTERVEIPFCDSGRSAVGDSMDVDDSSKLGPFSISVEKLNPEDDERRTQMDTCAEVKKSTIAFKLSSGLEVSSKPGVSIRVNVLPSRVNSLEGRILTLVASG